MEAVCIKAVAPERVELADFNFDADRLGPQDVLIRSQFSLTNSGTEVATFTGVEANIQERFTYPIVMGRANVGTVLKTGGGVTDLAEGDPVLTLGPHASAFKIETGRVLAKVPEGVDLAASCFARMGAVSITALRNAAPAAGDRVLVIGQGIVGNLAAQFFVIAGADVMAADTVDARLASARNAGIPHTVNPSATDLKQAVAEWTKGRGPEIVVEATGRVQTVPTAVSLVAPRGKVILLGTPREEAQMGVLDMLFRINAQGIILRGAFLSDFPMDDDPYVPHSIRGHVRQILAWIRESRLKTDALIVPVLQPGECQQGYESLHRGKDDCQAILFDWRGTT